MRCSVAGNVIPGVSKGSLFFEYESGTFLRNVGNRLPDKQLDACYLGCQKHVLKHPFVFQNMVTLVLTVTVSQNVSCFISVFQTEDA
jgi:hypothetical protein